LGAPGQRKALAWEYGRAGRTGPGSDRGGDATRAGLVLVGLALGLAGLGIARPALDSSPPGAPAAQRDIRALYLKDCAICHGSDGGGTRLGPTLVGLGPAAVDFQVSTGRMPLPSPQAESRRRTPKYSPATIRRLVAYVDSITGGGGLPIPEVNLGIANVSQGGELYRQQCAACHSWSGEGGALLDREAPSTHPATATQIAEAVRTGPGTMPAFGGAAIAENELDSLVAYTLYLDKPRDRGGEPLWGIGPLIEGAAAGLLGLGGLVLAIRWIGTRA
jgi:ubiquinol-cytochrome c reductase cytochrome c subunit